MKYGSIYKDASGATFDANNPLNRGARDRERDRDRDSSMDSSVRGRGPGIDRSTHGGFDKSSGSRVSKASDGHAHAQQQGGMGTIITDAGTRRNLSYVFVLAFVVLLIMGVVEVNRRNVLQPYLNGPEGNRLRHTDDAIPEPEASKVRTRRHSQELDNDTIESDGADAVVAGATGGDDGEGPIDDAEIASSATGGAEGQQEAAPSSSAEDVNEDDIVAASASIGDVTPSAGKVHDLGLVVVENLVGRYMTPAAGCILVSQDHMTNAVDTTQSKRICLSSTAPAPQGAVDPNDQIATVTRDDMKNTGKKDTIVRRPLIYLLPIYCHTHLLLYYSTLHCSVMS